MTWAKLSLARGSSVSSEWVADQSTTGSRVEIGSDPSCSWVLVGSAVAAKHVEIYWDGEVLWVARIQGAPEVRADGLLIDDWYALTPGATIEFGEAALTVSAGASAFDTSGLASRVGETSEVDLRHADPDDERARSNESLEAHFASDVPTALIDPGGSAPRLSGVATQIVIPSDHDDDAAERIAAFEADLGAQRQTRPIEDARAHAEGLPAAHATQLVSLPDEPLAPAADGAKPRPPPPRFGQNVQVSSGAAPPASKGYTAPAPRPPVEAPVETLPETPAEILIETPVETPVETPAAPEALPGEDADATSLDGDPPATDASPFAAPPAFDPKAKRASSGKRALPTRTWILLTVLVVALLSASLIGTHEEVIAPPQAPVAAGDASLDVTADADADADAGAAAIVDGSPGDAGDAGDAMVAADAGGDAGPSDLKPLEVRAAEALLANHFTDAYDLYGELAERHPDNELFAAMRSILARRIQASCRNGVDQQGQACEDD